MIVDNRLSISKSESSLPLWWKHFRIEKRIVRVGGEFNRHPVGGGDVHLRNAVASQPNSKGTRQSIEYLFGTRQVTIR